jgi:acyl-CoA reductase-like NAD-dependent aldehyde dehydrogenase
MTSYSMTIGGRSVPPQDDGAFDVFNPATGELIARAPECSSQQLEQAVMSARQAFLDWATAPMAERRARLELVAQALISNLDRLKRLLTAEQGKPLADSEAEIRSAANTLRSMAALDLPVETLETADKTIETRRVAIGVVAAIPPWNFPVTLAAMKIAPALLAGNTVILKPSPFTPLTTLLIGELTQSLLPPGVLNVVSGTDRLGAWLTEHPGIDKITFTGSTQTGRKVMQSASPGLKRVTLELGGNDPAIVLADVNVKRVTEKLFWSAFRNAGQVCVAAKRVYIHESIYESVAQSLCAYARTVKIGDGAAEGTRMGPLNNRQQYQRVLGLVEDARARGYQFLSGAQPIKGPGFYVPVTLIGNPPDESRVVQEEQFGPVLPLLKFDDLDEVISRANASIYGLGASVWSADPAQALRVGTMLDVGSVWINDAPAMHALAPFGGHKQSGIGAEGGMDALLGNTLSKTYFLPKEPASDSGH